MKLNDMSLNSIQSITPMFRMKDNTALPNIGWIQIFDHTTGTWAEVLSLNSVGTSYAYHSYEITSNLNEYIPTNNYTVWMRIHYDHTSNISVELDHVEIEAKITDDTIEITEKLAPGKFATGDYYCFTEVDQRYRIAANTENSIKILVDNQLEKIPIQDGKIEIQVRLQRPFIDIEKCIGCGICEHECPVSGRKAIRVSAEGETRSANRSILLKR